LKTKSENKVVENEEVNSTERVHYGSIEVKKNQVVKISMMGTGGRNYSSRQEVGGCPDSLIEMYGVKDAVQGETK